MTVVATGRRGWLMLLTLAAVAAGAALVVVALLAQRTAPQPPRSTGSVDTSVSPSSPAPRGGTTGSAQPEGSVPLGASRPVLISIPAIAVRSRVNTIGLNKDGTLAVPQPGPHLDQAAWFRNSPTPGQPGPSIIEGHVDSDSGPSVFFRLGSVRPGDRIRVLRADGIRVTFTVNAVRNFKKSHFPTDVVYGAKDLGQSQLRLITCSQFDPSIRHHVGNAVIFAHLTSTQH